MRGEECQLSVLPKQNPKSGRKSIFFFSFLSAQIIFFKLTFFLSVSRNYS